MTAMDAPVKQKVRGLAYGAAFCAHLVGDDPDELHQVAASIGLERHWFMADPRLPHYDLIGREKIAAAKRLGVPEVERAELLRLAKACGERLKVKSPRARSRVEEIAHPERAR